LGELANAVIRRSVEIDLGFLIRHQRFGFFFFTIFSLRGFFTFLELTLDRKGRGLFFGARNLIGLGFAMSLTPKTERLDASPSLFIAVIILSRTDLALSVPPRCSR
jgi:hypothetical protein